MSGSFPLTLSSFFFFFFASSPRIPSIHRRVLMRDPRVYDYPWAGRRYSKDPIDLLFFGEVPLHSSGQSERFHFHGAVRIIRYLGVYAYHSYISRYWGMLIRWYNTSRSTTNVYHLSSISTLTFFLLLLPPFLHRLSLITAQKDWRENEAWNKWTWNLEFTICDNRISEVFPDKAGESIFHLKIESREI